MQLSGDQTREILLVELDLHKTEYSTLREEIVSWNEAERQFLNLSIIAAGAGIGFAQFITGAEAQIIWLLFPLVFHVFFREMLDCTRHITEISKYLVEILIPRVNLVLDKLGADRQQVTSLGWECRSASEPLNLFLFIIQPMRYWIPVSAIVALLLLYAVNVVTYNYRPPLGHIVLIVLNILFVILSILRSGKSFQDYKRHSDKLYKQIQFDKEKAETKGNEELA